MKFQQGRNYGCVIQCPTDKLSLIIWNNWLLSNGIILMFIHAVVLICELQLLCLCSQNDRWMGWAALTLSWINPYKSLASMSPVIHTHCLGVQSTWDQSSSIWPLHSAVERNWDTQDVQQLFRLLSDLLSMNHCCCTQASTEWLALQWAASSLHLVR